MDGFEIKKKKRKGTDSSQHAGYGQQGKISTDGSDGWALMLPPPDSGGTEPNTGDGEQDCKAGDEGIGSVATG